jgi:hypothetical protein
VQTAPTLADTRAILAMLQLPVNPAFGDRILERSVHPVLQPGRMLIDEGTTSGTAGDPTGLLGKVLLTMRRGRYRGFTMQAVVLMTKAIDELSLSSLSSNHLQITDTMSPIGSHAAIPTSSWLRVHAPPDAVLHIAAD